MKNRGVLLTLLLTLLLLLGACQKPVPVPSATPSPSPSPTPAVSATPKPLPFPSATTRPSATPVTGSGFDADGKPVNNPVAAGKSPTTGLDWKGEYKPMLVMIENSAEARPQWGLSQADVVYELTVEGSITRFLALYSDNLPEKLGPVRSCRLDFVDVAVEWDSALVHFGGADDPTYSVPGKIKSAGIRMDVDGMTNSKYFTRESSRKAPHNVSLYGQKLLADIKDASKTRAFLFTPVLPNGLADGKGVTIDYKTQKTSYAYDADKNVYLRSISGKAHVDNANGKQITATNIIIQQTTHKGHSDKIHLLVNMIGEGEAQYLVGGKLIQGKWVRKFIDQRTVYLDDKGMEVALLPGNTYIQLVSSMDVVTVQ